MRTDRSTDSGTDRRTGMKADAEDPDRPLQARSLGWLNSPSIQKSVEKKQDLRRSAECSSDSVFPRREEQRCGRSVPLCLTVAGRQTAALPVLPPRRLGRR